jgi:hypothetical protein
MLEAANYALPGVEQPASEAVSACSTALGTDLTGAA